jgi:molybdopterin molybdotransferase
MILSVDEALQKVVAHAGLQPVVESSLADALGRTLAEDVVADRDSPPFAKSLMDGFAVRNADLESSRAELRVVGTLLAGSTAAKRIEPGETYRIMTGAPIPEGADAVVMIERSRESGDHVILEDPGFRPGQNVMPRGRELTAGQVVLRRGHRLGPAEIGLLATVGFVHPKVYRRPSIAILTTGDEIVHPEESLGPAQIRNSNGSTVLALVQQTNAQPVSLGIVGDDRDALKSAISTGLSNDLLLLTGGVSAGAADFVPGVLQELGVQQVFHKAAFKPGQPVWFGSRGETLVFGLPGNPVSVLVCFKLFVETALRVRQACSSPLPPIEFARLSREVAYPTARLTYHPAKRTWDGDGPVVEPVAWYGSPDLCALTKADCLLVLPATDSPHPAGAWMRVLPLS